MSIGGGLDWTGLLAIGCSVAASLLGAGHALLTKRDPRSAAAWVVICLLFPLLGVTGYVLIGNNRIRKRARRLHALPLSEDAQAPMVLDSAVTETLIAPEYRNLAYLGRAASGNELLTGNSVDALFDGDEAYPAMLAAIREARDVVHLASYIFSPNGAGAAFVDELAAAVQRGITVRVLLDGAGEWYSWPHAGDVLRRAGVTVERFLPPRLLPPNFSLNLRNHRKILVVDGELAFTGGMNIRDKHVTRPGEHEPRVRDVHFRLCGPVVAQIDALFRSDWSFCSGEPLPEPARPAALPGDSAECRLIADGPSEDLDRMLWVMVGAIAAARTSIRIMTPYFLPPRELAVALQTAALRGVDVRVVLPAHNNFVFMTWAAVHALGSLLRTGVRVFFLDGPFTHAKLLIVDDYYVQLGSSNLDPRSLRLNFEMLVEVYDGALARRLAGHVDASLGHSREFRHADWRARRLPRRLRDAFCWLFSPYL